MFGTCRFKPFIASLNLPTTAFQLAFSTAVQSLPAPAAKSRNSFRFVGAVVFWRAPMSKSLSCLAHRSLCPRVFCARRRSAKSTLLDRLWLCAARRSPCRSLLRLSGGGAGIRNTTAITTARTQLRCPCDARNRHLMTAPSEPRITSIDDGNRLWRRKTKREEKVPDLAPHVTRSAARGPTLETARTSCDSRWPPRRPEQCERSSASAACRATHHAARCAAVVRRASARSAPCRPRSSRPTKRPVGSTRTPQIGA